MQKISLVSDIDYLESIVYEIDEAKTIMDIDEIYSELQDSTVTLRDNKKIKKVNNSSSGIHPASKNRAKKNTHSKKDAGYGEPLKFEIDGFTVLVGKNNRQNDYLTTRLANKEDIWLHVKDAHGSHVILRTENKIPSQDTINKCARLAKEYSKSSESSNVPVDYTFVKFVKKPSGSKPGMVIYTNNKSVNV